MTTLTEKEVKNTLKWTNTFMKEKLESLFSTLEEVSKQDKEIFLIC